MGVLAPRVRKYSSFLARTQRTRLRRSHVFRQSLDRHAFDPGALLLEPELLWVHCYEATRHIVRDGMAESPPPSSETGLGRTRIPNISAATRRQARATG